MYGSLDRRPLLSLPQISHILGLSRRAIRNALAAGVFPPPFTATPGGQPRWLTADIRKFMRAGMEWPLPSSED